MTKASFGCLAILVPLSLMWACGSSTDGGDTSNGEAGASGSVAGADGSGADGSGASATTGGTSLDLGGEGNLGGVGSGTGGSSGGTLTGTGGTVLGGGGTTATDLCGDAGCVCSNGIDDDEDGLADGFDPECTGPYDNDESSFATGIPGDNRDPKWQDCFFDGNSGAGDDGCRYRTECLTGELDQTDKDCTLTQACIDFCAPRTPNGCDCFGCCTVTLADGDTIDIMTGADCSVDKAEDAAACPVCTKSAQCENTCGRCELCPGKTVEDIPDDCTPPPTGTGGTSGTGGSSSTGGSNGTGGTPPDPGYSCEGGLQVCGDGLPGCPVGRYCSFGCCLLLPPR
jgi:hypothetical protein